jgi:protein involved in polysaccharide export with SLBB domain
VGLPGKSALVLAGLVAAAGTACATSASLGPKDVARQNAAEARKPRPPTDYVLAAGDVITVKFFYNPELNEQLPIRPDGKASLQLAGDVQAAGLTVEGLRQHLIARYTGVIKHPELVVIVNSFGAQKVYVGGEVNRPGEVALVSDLTTLQAVIMAGGQRSSAGLRNVVIVRDQGTETPLILLVDLKEIVSSRGGVPDVPLQARDIVYVPMSTIARVDAFVRQYVTELLPIALGFNLNYNFGNILGGQIQ